MRTERVGAVIVADDEGHLLGVFTGRDAICRVLAEIKDPTAVTLGEVMTTEPDCLPSHATAIEALRMMRDGGYRHLPVVDDGCIVGVVSRGDFRGIEKDRLDHECGLWERIA